MKLMKFFKRRKQRNKSEAPGASEVFGKNYRQFGGSMPAQPRFYTEEDYLYGRQGRPYSPNRASAARLAALPAPVLERIFAFVCPHTQDCSYETQEQSSIEDACMLCDLRDLSHCIQVNRRWCKTAAKVLYVLCRVPTTCSIPFRHSCAVTDPVACVLEAICADSIFGHVAGTIASESRQSTTATARPNWRTSASAGPSSTAMASPKTHLRSD